LRELHAPKHILLTSNDFSVEMESALRARTPYFRPGLALALGSTKAAERAAAPQNLRTKDALSTS